MYAELSLKRLEHIALSHGAKTHTHTQEDKRSVKSESPWKVETSCSRFILVEQIQN